MRWMPAQDLKFSSSIYVTGILICGGWGGFVHSTKQQNNAVITDYDVRYNIASVCDDTQFITPILVSEKVRAKTEKKDNEQQVIIMEAIKASA